MIHDLDPVFLHLGPLKIHWYGMMYLIGFGLAWVLGRRRAKLPHSGMTPHMVDDLIFYGALGVILGGRLGYVFFYDYHTYLYEPWRIFQVWKGGMSFHGGFIGVCVAGWLFARRHRRRFFTLFDFTAPLVPLALGAGRIGNFINGELWGKVTEVPWGVIFPRAGELPRHPSQLYQAFSEGLLLFALVWIFSRKRRPEMAVSAVFIMGYGFFRFITEFFRLPDAHIGYLAWGWLTMGQFLSLPMLLGGGYMLWLAYNKEEKKLNK